VAALSPSPPRPERRPLWLGGLEREYLCSQLWAAVASGGTFYVEGERVSVE